jgi:hypothetical protein
MRKIVSVVILVCVAVLELTADTSQTYSPLTQSPLFNARVQFIVTQEAPVILTEAATGTYTAACHTLRANSRRRRANRGCVRSSRRTRDQTSTSRQVARVVVEHGRRLHHQPVRAEWSAPRDEILDDFLSFIGAAGDDKARNRAERLLNRVLEKIWMQRGWSCFIDPDVWTIATVSGTRAYALPDHFGRVSGTNRVIRDLTNGRNITPRDRNDLEEEDPTTGTTFEVPGCPRQYMIAGTTPVQAQPAAAGEALEVLSDSASDTTVRAFIEGLTTGNLVARRQVTLNGVTPVAIGTWKRVSKFGKSYPAGTTPTTELTSSEGSVTLRTVAAATSLQILALDQAAREHQALVLSPVPDGVYSIGVPILRGIERTYLDGDPLPPMWTNAVLDGLTQNWRVSDGDTPEALGMWPSLVELIQYDNAQLAQGRHQRQPYRGA